MANILKGIDEILFFVDNLSEAKDWIRNLTGNEPVFSSDNYYSFNLGFNRIGLHPSDKKCGTGIAGQVAYWNVDNINNAIEHFIEHGCKIFRGPIVGVDGVSICQMIDPFGNAWGLVQRAPE